MLRANLLHVNFYIKLYLKGTWQVIYNLHLGLFSVCFFPLFHHLGDNLFALSGLLTTTLSLQSNFSIIVSFLTAEFDAKAIVNKSIIMENNVHIFSCILNY